MIYFNGWWLPYDLVLVADAGNSNVWFPILSAAAVIIAAVVAYFGARLKNSGKIVTSDSTELWAEGKAIRLELRDEIRRLTAENVELKDRVGVLEEDNGTLKRRVESLEGENEQLKQRVTNMEGKK